ncbi:FMN-linked oxidoreductase, partial [Clavulina sp. PMI_390]
NYRNGVVLAPMVRSGTLPSRLLALKYGADLVWGPEIVDRGMIGCSRVVDDATGVITYEKAGKPIWSTHPIEKPYLIYQVGSANPDLAAQSAMIVAQDVSGVELNCGCPKPFSTHAGMGANLLSTPDLLCDILVKLRSSLPQSIAVSAKIRMLPSQEDTLALVRRIVSTGISCLTVHCRTKEMRKRESALIHRLREIVECVEEMGLGIPVIANGDCLSRDDAVRLRDVTGAHSVMIATAAEKNLSCFAPGPLVDAESVLAPAYISLARYINNPWGNSKHCLSQFSSPGTSNDSIVGRKASLRDFKQRLAQAKGYE